MVETWAQDVRYAIRLLRRLRTAAQLQTPSAPGRSHTFCDNGAEKVQFLL